MSKAARENKVSVESGDRLWLAQTLTCRVVIESVSIFLSAIASKEGFVVVVLIPVKRLDLQSPALWMAADDAGHSLVYLGGGAGAVHVGQKHHLLSHVTPAPHAEQLMSGTGRKKGGKGKISQGQSKGWGQRRERNTLFS